LQPPPPLVAGPPPGDSEEDGYALARPEASVPPPPDPRPSGLQSLQSQLPAKVVAPTEPDDAAHSRAGHHTLLYGLFAITLIPLALSLLGTKDNTMERLQKTLQSHPDVVSKIQGLHCLSREGILSKLPGRKIEGALLAHDSWVHWFYALLAALAFFIVVLLLFDLGRASLRHVLLVGLGTATAGILFLLSVQFAANVTYGVVFYGRSIVVLLFYIVKFIGFSYRAATDPTAGFWLSLLGFTFGVGLCEELTKAMPVLFHFRGGGRLDFRGASMWGLASGIGFGIAEGIMYSSHYYNGFSTGGIYLVRFVSCVGLHAIWGAAVAIMVYRRRDWITRDWEWGDMAATLLYVLAVPMVLHGLYDTLLKKDMHGPALLAALASFAWLVLLTEWTRRQESAAQTRVPAYAGQ
jgi:RsiW-degrading membrane proteinase PrsW (M82 family)